MPLFQSRTLLGTAVALSLSSCSDTIYLKDVIYGSPYDRSHDRVYQNALAEGLDPEAAERRALLVDSNHSSETWSRRKAEEEQDKDDRDDDDTVHLKWN
ncbi:hypothetical protein Rhal01_02037 [Rubritalea halochordaticola]|uniref:DUF4136 domain-containing protein n=1 Tax=Rubritalea halochordaticola TaxID=714537 RepID=A0ABP9V3F3_9BACT